MAASATAAALQQAAAGLTYESETDAPWQAFAWPEAEGAPTGDKVKEYGRHKGKGVAREQAVDAFFAPLVQDQDWYGEEEKAQAAKYRTLLGVVKQVLVAPKVVTVGGRRATVYVVGQAPEGGWAGLKTTAVET